MQSTPLTRECLLNFLQLSVGSDLARLHTFARYEGNPGPFMKGQTELTVGHSYSQLLFQLHAAEMRSFGKVSLGFHLAFWPLQLWL